jgi:hypothetical protein
VIERLRQLAALAPPERSLLLTAWLLFVLVKVVLRLFALPRVLPRGRRSPTAGAALPVERILAVAAIARRRAPRPTCLEEALVLGWVLRWSGVPATVRIGVSRTGGTLRAHAWVEHDGRVIAGALAGGAFAPLVASAAAPGRA